MTNERRIILDELAADRLATILGGSCYLTDENAWIVAIRRSDGRVVIVTCTSVDEYADWEAFEAGHCYASIRIS